MAASTGAACKLKTAHDFALGGVFKAGASAYTRRSASSEDEQVMIEAVTMSTAHTIQKNFDLPP